MKPDYNALEQQLKRAVEHETPDVLQNVLQQIKTEGASDTAADMPVHLVAQRKKPSMRVRWASGIAAVFIMATVFLSYQYLTPATFIGFDVNPSIQLNVNGFDKVLEATALNDDGYTVLDDMNLKNTDIDVAVNAIIGSMVKNGFINEANNSILVSIDGKNNSKSSKLQQSLLTEISDTLSYYAVEGVVISQTISDGETLQQLAETYGISLGKAALIEQLVARDSSLTFEELSGLSINDICLLITAGYPDLDGIETAGEVSSIAYIGEDSARGLVLSHAKLDEDEILSYKTELGLRDERVVYIIEFRSADAAYYYCVDATTGNIIEFERDVSASGDIDSTEPPAPGIATEATSPQSESAPPPSESKAAPVESNDNAVEASQAAPSAPAALTVPETASGAPASPSAAATGAGEILSSDEVMSIALAHAGISTSAVSKSEVELKQKSNSSYYEIEIKTSDGSKYKFEVEAYTGAILEYKSDVKDGGNANGGSSDSGLISKEEAFSIAFADAGISGADLKKKEIELEEEHGVKVYEIEFTLTNGKEFKYKINAVSGAIIERESE